MIVQVNGKMQAGHKQTFKLCHIFKERQEFIWGFDDDSEVEDGSCQGEMLSQPSAIMPTIQGHVSPTEIGSGLPSCRYQVYSAKEIDWQRASSYAKTSEGSNGYPNTVEQSGKYVPDVDLSVGFYEEEDTESSSEEQNHALDMLDASCDTQEGPLPKCVIYRKMSNVQAAELYRSDCNEMTPLNRDERQMYRVVMPEKGPDRQQFLSHQTRGSGRCHSHVPAGPQTVSPQQVNTRRKFSLPQKAQPRCGYSHQPTEGLQSSPGLAHTSTNRSYSQQPAGNLDYSCRQTQPKSPSYPHHQTQYRNETRVSSQASKMYILRQKSTIKCVPSHKQRNVTTDEKVLRHQYSSSFPDAGS